ncbi:putative reverse transcriptase domain-containing protein [Tanacetum coccineum]
MPIQLRLSVLEEMASQIVQQDLSVERNCPSSSARGAARYNRDLIKHLSHVLRLRVFNEADVKYFSKYHRNQDEDKSKEKQLEDVASCQEISEVFLRTWPGYTTHSTSGVSNRFGFRRELNKLTVKNRYPLPRIDSPYSTSSEAVHVHNLALPEGSEDSSIMRCFEKGFGRCVDCKRNLVVRSKIWRHYLYGTKCTVFTDHKSLQHILDQKELNYDGTSAVSGCCLRAQTEARKQKRKHQEGRLLGVYWLRFKRSGRNLEPEKLDNHVLMELCAYMAGVGFQVYGDKVRRRAYKLELPQELSRVHNTFHVSNLKKCYYDDPLVVPLEGLQVDDKLHFVEEPVEIMDCVVKQLRQSRVPIIKV